MTAQPAQRAHNGADGSASHANAAAGQSSLRDYVALAVGRYLSDMDDHDIDDLYEIVLREVEAPLFAEVMRHTDGNQSRAAATLGINRATLRKKLRLYGLG
ncbi:DNA-binding transcriptional regulator Fis [Coralloluteibacterium thermophilus]|uniref:Putative Fis-like DNA-binding protein n=1 Tax=Coralloluteibacterium thermophilum TaxID=2707049 RepID=A0ABV9NFT2_9GAMM